MSSAGGADIVMQAAEWAARLDAGDMTDADHAACAAWVRQDPTHGDTLARIGANFARLTAADDFERQAARHLLRGTGRRRVAIAVGIGAALLGAGLIVNGDWPTTQEIRTARGEQEIVQLADGSGLTLDTDSAVQVALGRKRRGISLEKGQIYAEVAKDQTRPFVVETRDGTATALGTAFIVHRSASDTIVIVTESHVRVCLGGANLDDSRCRTLGPGNQVRFTQQGFTAMPDVDPEAAAQWTRGWLEADDQDLVQVLAQLSRYSTAPLRFDPSALGGRRVTGSFPLGDTALALRGIAQAADVDVLRQQDGIIVIRPR